MGHFMYFHAISNSYVRLAEGNGDFWGSMGEYSGIMVILWDWIISGLC